MTLQSTITKILQLAAQDQALHQTLLEKGELNDSYHPELESLHQANAAALVEIINAIGYPTARKVGVEGSKAAWLTIQHAISRPAFMMRCAELLGDATKSGEGNPQHLAYLTDRIATFRGEPQRYGTQFDWDEAGQLRAQPLDSVEAVNRRRASLGWNTLAEHTEEMRKSAADEGQRPPADLEDRNRKFTEWKKRVGWIESEDRNISSTD